MESAAALNAGSLDDVGLARRIAARDRAAVRTVMSQNNQRLFRAAWSILQDRTEAEDAVQSAYLAAFRGIHAFEGRSAFSTWLMRILINEALGRKRKADRRRRQLDQASVAVMEEYREKLMQGSNASTPDSELAREQVRIRLERAISALPAEFRTVFVLREVEGLSVEETAQSLDLAPGTVKTRALRARRRLQEMLEPEFRAALNGTFPFAGADCEAMTERVIALYCD